MSLLRAQPDSSKRSYIATDNFYGDFFSYTTTTDAYGVTHGVWGDAANDPGQTPRGRILRENGKKLYKDANPDVNQYYVGVYDAVTGLRGYIDPNNAVFAIFNSDKPTYLDDNYSDDGGSDDNSEGPDLGNPVYTQGDITTKFGNILALNVDNNNGAHVGIEDASGAYGEFYTYGSHPPNVAVEVGNDTPCVYAGMYGDDGSIWCSGLINPFNSVGTVALSGGGAIVTNDIFKSNPYLFITRRTYAVVSGGLGVLTYSINTGTGALTITSSNNTETSDINWLAIGSSEC